MNASIRQNKTKMDGMWDGGTPGNKRITNCLVSLYGKTKPSIASYSPPLRVVQPSASRRAAPSNFGHYFPVKTDQTVSNPLVTPSFLRVKISKLFSFGMPIYFALIFQPLWT